LQTGCDWPPPFAENVRLYWQRSHLSVVQPLLAEVPQELYEVDSTTIWWKNSSTGLLPWAPLAFTNGVPNITGTIPFMQRMFVSYFDSAKYQSDEVVSSLHSQDESVIITKRQTGLPATTGDLDLSFIPKFNDVEDANSLTTAIKKIDGLNATIGHVVTGISVDSENIRITESSGQQGSYHYGNILISASDGIIKREIPFDSIHLQGVEESLEYDFPGLSFSPYHKTSLIASIQSPVSESLPSFYAVIQLGFMVLRSGVIPADLLKLYYKILPKPDGTNKIANARYTTWTPLSCDVSVTNAEYSLGHYSAISSVFPLGSGDTVILKIEREAPDSWSSPIIIVRSGMTIVDAANVVVDAPTVISGGTCNCPEIKKYTGTFIGNGAQKTFTVSHGLGTTTPFAFECFLLQNGETIPYFTSWNIVNANTITIDFSIAPPAGAVYVVNVFK